MMRAHRALGIREALLAVVALGLLVRPVRASTITLDFDTVATGSTIITTPLLTSLGTITASKSDAAGFLQIQVATSVTLPASFGQVLLHVQAAGGDSDYGQFAFDFDVASITFLYGGGGEGVFTGQALNSSFGIVDSFFDSDTDGDSPGGPVTLTGAGIRYFRFGDFPSPATLSRTVGIDNVTISDTFAVPEPTSMLLLGTGLIGAGVRRYRQRCAKP